MRGWAFGLLGIPRAEFYMMPVGEFWEAMRAYGIKEEANAKHLGELARGAALRLFNVQLRRKDQIKDPSKFWPMPWDDIGSDSIEPPKEVKERSLAKLLKIMNSDKRNGKQEDEGQR